MNTERSVVAQRARELLVALATPAPQGYPGVPVLLGGAPGSGNSSGAGEAWAERRRCSSYSPSRMRYLQYWC